MRDAVKGGAFVGAAVATGILAGFLVLSMIGPDRDAAKGRAGAHRSLDPRMPGVVGRPLDEARGELSRRGISYSTDAPDIIEETVPQFLEVCGSEPGPGDRVRGSARLRTAIAGTCGI